MSEQTRAEMLHGTSERRAISEFELRETGDGLLTFNGYAAVWDQSYTVTDFLGSFTESVDRGAVSRTLSRSPNVVLNINHGRDGGLPLARSTSGTLRIGTDAHGLHVESSLDLRNPKVQELQSVLDRRDVQDMSWAFRVTVDEWTTIDGEEFRVIKEANIDGGDVSIVTNGANPGTVANPLRSALEALAAPDLDLKVLAECRADGIDFDVIRKNLASAMPSPRKTLSLRAAERALLID